MSFKYNRVGYNAIPDITIIYLKKITSNVNSYSEKSRYILN